MGLKINLHITEKCNYRCRYCFAHFQDSKDLPMDDWMRIIDNISNCSEIDAINFAGGEPLLFRGFPELLEYSASLGYRLSVISNGSLLLNSTLMPPHAFRLIETLGISVDTVDPGKLIELGACTRSCNVLNLKSIMELISAARKENPKLKIKFNTVVSRVNKDDDLNELDVLKEADRWKVLRMKIFKNNTFNNENLSVTDDEFASFVKRHRGASRNLVVEDNMIRSYIMVDNRGWLLDNTQQDYRRLGCLLDEDFSSVFRRYDFDSTAYAKRYSQQGKLCA